jgi:hypothetical protein
MARRLQRLAPFEKSEPAARFPAGRSARKPLITLLEPVVKLCLVYPQGRSSWHWPPPGPRPAIRSVDQCDKNLLLQRLPSRQSRSIQRSVRCRETRIARCSLGLFRHACGTHLQSCATRLLPPLGGTHVRKIRHQALLNNLAVGAASRAVVGKLGRFLMISLTPVMVFVFYFLASNYC